MSLASVEKKVDGVCKDVREIKESLVGSLEGKPGIQDRLRDVEKRQKYLFLLSGAALFGFVWVSANGGISTLIKLIVGVIS